MPTPLKKQLAMGIPGAKAEACGSRDRTGKFAKGGPVKAPKKAVMLGLKKVCK